jgi:hypothetical protein
MGGWGYISDHPEEKWYRDDRPFYMSNASENRKPFAQQQTWAWT